jgi:hypothetical protein
MNNLASALLDFATPADELRVHPSNTRRGDLDAIAASLARFGQLRPVVCLPDGTIVAGNHTYRAATEVLAWASVAAVRVELTDDEAERYLLADNRTADRAVYDDAALAEVLVTMMEAGRLDGTGYEPDDVDDLIVSVRGIAELEAVPEFAPDYIEDPEATAGRYHNPADHVPMRQVVLLYAPEVYEAFMGDVKRLQRVWGVAGAREVIREAVARARAREEVPAA